MTGEEQGHLGVDNLLCALSFVFVDSREDHLQEARTSLHSLKAARV